MLTDWGYDSVLGEFEITGPQNLVSSPWTGILNVLFNVNAVKKSRVLSND